MAYNDTINYQHPWPEPCPKCGTNKAYRKITIDEYNIIQSGTTKVGKQILQIFLGFFARPRKLLRDGAEVIFGNVSNLQLSHCETCGIHYYRCPSCKNVHPVGTHSLSGDVFIVCKNCETKLQI